MSDDFPPVAGVEHRHVDAGGVRLHVAEAGDPDAPPILLLHGWPQHWWMWRRVMTALAGRYRLIAPDLRGFGWSEAPGHGYDVETFARDAVALLDALAIERLPVAGHDWGGITGFLAALRHPERVERLLMLGSTHTWGRASAAALLQGWRTSYAAVMATPVVGSLALRAGYPRLLLPGPGSNPVFSDEERDVYAGRLREAPRRDATIALYRNYYRLLGRIGAGAYRKLRLRVPTHLVLGERDFAIPKEFAEGYEPYADDFTLELLPDAAHFLVDEVPDLVIDRLRWVAGERDSRVS